MPLSLLDQMWVIESLAGGVPYNIRRLVWSEQPPRDGRSPSAECWHGRQQTETALTAPTKPLTNHETLASLASGSLTDLFFEVP